jgi:hypothetical protein
VHRYLVTLGEDAGGLPRAVFSFAGGTTRGTLPLSSDEASRLSAYNAYVSDVQLGSYEPSNPADPARGLVCRLSPTFHFYCPATGALDQLCLTWSGRPRETGTTGFPRFPSALPSVCRRFSDASPVGWGTAGSVQSRGLSTTWPMAGGEEG